MSSTEAKASLASAKAVGSTPENGWPRLPVLVAAASTAAVTDVSARALVPPALRT